MRIMGLDLGDKTIGVALSDPLGLTAQALEVVCRNGSLKDDLIRLKEIARANEVTRIVIGLPRNMNGTIGPRGELALEFTRQVEQSLGLPAETWDERLSTVAAERVLLDANMRRKKRRQVIDKIAAAVILQNYLDARVKS
ncbi:MAG: Holliday junction resolvase RuvX [Bacillota bacterium]